MYIVNRNFCGVFTEKDVGSNFVWIHETRLKLEVAFCTERTADEDSKHATSEIHIARFQKEYVSGSTSRVVPKIIILPYHSTEKNQGEHWI